MSLRSFLGKQFIDVIQWNEDEDGVLAYRYPMQDMEIQTGGQLTVRESQMAAFVNEGRIADVFPPGLHTLNTRNLPLLTDLMNWDKAFESPFKSDVYFFSTRLQIDQRWGTATPITIRDKEYGAVRLRGYGIYSYRVADPRAFYTNVSGTRDIYRVADLEGQLRETIVARMTDTFANSDVPFLDMAAHQATLAQKIADHASPAFKALGLELNQLIVENLSLPDELQKVLDQRIGMTMVGDLEDRRPREPGVQSAGPGTEPVDRRESFAAGRTTEGAGSAHRHDHGGRPWALRAIRGGASHPDCGGQRRWRGWRGGGAGGRH